MPDFRGASAQCVADHRSCPSRKVPDAAPNLVAYGRNRTPSGEFPREPLDAAPRGAPIRQKKSFLVPRGASNRRSRICRDPYAPHMWGVESRPARLGREDSTRMCALPSSADRPLAIAPAHRKGPERPEGHETASVRAFVDSFVTRPRVAAERVRPSRIAYRRRKRPKKEERESPEQTDHQRGQHLVRRGCAPLCGHENHRIRVEGAEPRSRSRGSSGMLIRADHGHGGGQSRRARSTPSIGTAYDAGNRRRWPRGAAR